MNHCTTGLHSTSGARASTHLEVLDASRHAAKAALDARVACIEDLQVHDDL